MTEHTPAAAPRYGISPLILGAVAILLLLLAVYFWPQSHDEPAPQAQSPATEPAISEPAAPQPVATTAPVAAPPQPLPERPPSVIPEQAKPEPLDISDKAIITALEGVAEIPALTDMLVTDDLLRRFVVYTDNLANSELAENFAIFKAPDKPFRIYQQGGKQWVDAASYKRYTPYVESLEAMSVDSMMTLYQRYKPAIQSIYQEVGYEQNFDQTLLGAIEQLLDTPEIPIPVEVYSDSVMYKYRDERLENLTPVQKQLLRTGPENMRRIKAKLRELRDKLSI